jgi:YVTN family beta-propeller protein
VRSRRRGRPVRTVGNTAGTPITVGYSSRAIAITPNGRSAYVVDYFGHTVSMINTVTNKVTATIDVSAYPWAIAITP